MARKGQVTIQDTVETNEELEAYIEENYDRLICMEVYSEFCGNCQATLNAVRKGKLEIGGDNVAMLKALADKIDVLERFKYKSEPVFLFLQKGKLTRAMFGANGIELCRILEEELGLMKAERDLGIQLPKYELNELLPMEAEKLEQDQKMDREYTEAAERLKVLTYAARKKRVNQRLAYHVKRLNFIMFWPQHHQAHYDLYEKWDMINISVAAKDTFQLTEETAREVLYMSDVDLNEACMHALLSGEVMVTLFKMFDTDDRDFVQLMRHTLYEEVPEPKDDVPPEKQLPPIPAFERYASISKTAREVRRDRYNAKMQKLREEEEERRRLQAEQDRLAREAEEERLRVEKQKAEEERMARIQAGLPADPEPEAPPEGEAVEGEQAEGEGGEGGEKPDTEAPPGEGVEGEGPTVQGEEKPEEEEFHSDVEVEGEDYIPPGGLFVPGLYTPPNDLAKANGLKFFFRKVVLGYAPIDTEIMPKHVLVMFTVEKRHEILEIIKQFPEEILNFGIFVGDDPFSAEHVAYTVKQYDKMTRLRKHKDRVALMVSRQRSLPLLQLAGLSPVYISSDSNAGERDCLTLFPVGYADEYVEEESIKEEEIKEVEVVKEEVVEEPAAPEEAEEEEDEEET